MLCYCPEIDASLLKNPIKTSQYTVVENNKKGRKKFEMPHFSTDLAQIFTNLLTFDTDHIVALKMEKKFPFHAYL